ncbi:MAG: hypothetical protein N2109_00120 [Fimbriimonadales bacterium]|nr:hypothetical protein [Fimbriimonadales bacterium]
MLHLVPALLILWLNGALADRPALPSAVRAALLELGAGTSSNPQSLRALQAWLGERVGDEVLQRLGAWLESPAHAAPEAEALEAERVERLRIPRGLSSLTVGGPPPGVSRFRDGPNRLA